MDRSLVSLMVAILLLEIGSGLQGVLLPVRAEIAGYPVEVIGALGTLHYVGFVLGCIRLPALIRRIGHVRCFSALSAIAACACLVYPLVEHPVVWMVLRVIVGFCFAGLFMVTESWLNDSTTVETRGRVLGFYMVATWVGVILGKLIYSQKPPESLHHFSLVAIAVLLSMVPLALTNGAVPSIPQASRMRLTEVYAVAPIGFVGCFAIGLANSAFWTFGPLFARSEIGVGQPVGYFMAACALGGAILQWPVGRISDGIDRRWVLFFLCLASVAVATALAFIPTGSELQTYGLGIAHLCDWNTTFRKYDIKAEVKNGRVTLTGDVDWQYQRADARDYVSRLRGVTGVTNSIAIRPHASQIDVKRKISAALQRSANLEASKINVDVIDGKVTLKGHVKAWYERKLAEDAAWSAPGVTSVVDKIQIS